MLQGFARATGKKGSAIATSGPCHESCYRYRRCVDSTQWCITGQVGKHLLGSDAFQETDIIRISNQSEVEQSQRHRRFRRLHKAFTSSRSGRPGPVLIDITKNAQFDLLDFSIKKCKESELCCRSKIKIRQNNGRS
jgi:acetolactate synthase-1/2/3 large subunit